MTGGYNANPNPPVLAYSIPLVSSVRLNSLQYHA
jgi:hypothetical protein